MAAFRAVLIAIMILALAATPLFAPSSGDPSSSDATAFAAGNAVRSVAAQNSNGNNNNNGNDNEDNDDNDNDDDDDDDDNDNDGDDDDDDDGDDNDNEDFPAPILVGEPGRGNESRVGVTKCFDVQEVGVIQMGNSDFDVTVSVVPSSGFNTVTRLSLRRLDPASVPAPPSGASLVGNVVFALDAQSGCDGPAIVPLGAEVNLGIVTKAGGDKTKFQIVRLEGGSWVDVDTVPDPSPTNPYISATIASGGTYAVVMEP